MTDATIVTVQPLIQVLLPYVASIAVALLTAAGGWLTAKLSKYLNASQQAVIQQAIGAAATRGAGIAYQALATAGANIGNIPVHNAAVAGGVNYVLNSMADTIKAAGITPDHISNMVTAELGKLMAVDAGVTIGAVASIPAPAPAPAPAARAPVTVAPPVAGLTGPISPTP
jgi:hypothetical protein